MRERTKQVLALGAALILALSVTACGKKDSGASKAGTPAATTAPTPTPAVTPSPAERIVGKWSIQTVTDQDGNEIDASRADVDGAAKMLLGNVMKPGASVEFTAEGKIKFSILSADYQFEDESTIKVSSDLIDTALSIPIEVTDSELKLKVSGYTASLSRVK